MSKSEQSLSILSQGTFEYYEVTEHGITFRPATPKGTWLRAVQQLCGMFEGAEMTRQRALMMLADALNYGQDEYGEEFAQAIDGTREALGLSPKTIANAQWVYGKIDASRRRDGLTLGHMSVIASLPVEAQETMMVTAIMEHMTVSQLKETVAEIHPKTKRGKDRKKKAKANENTDTAESILQKLSDSSAWLKANKPTEKMKQPLADCHLAFRRKWQTGVKKK